jgi:hypothetical protein
VRDGAGIAAALGGRGNGKGWQFRCPVHDGRVASCAIRRSDGLVTCFAGCPREQVEAKLDALGFADDGCRLARSWTDHVRPDALAVELWRGAEGIDGSLAADENICKRLARRTQAD